MVTKDEDKELPIPVEWRQTLYTVVEYLVKNDHYSIGKIPLQTHNIRWGFCRPFSVHNYPPDKTYTFSSKLLGST